MLAGDLPPDPDLQKSVAALMLDAGLARRAQNLYERQLQANPRDPVALAGAGTAAFETGNFVTAETLLARAVAAGAEDARVTSALATARLIGTLDPYRRGLTLRRRAERALRALSIAEARLHACQDTRPDARFAGLAEAVESHRSTLDTLASRDLDAVDAAMDLVFQIEHATAAVCGTPEGPDRALRLLGEQRGGSS